MAPPLNNQSAAVVDVVLSTHSRGYRNAEMISHELFPRAPIGNRSAKTIRFGKESFRKLNTRRAPGADMKTVQFGYMSDPVGLDQDSLQGLVPVEFQEEATAVPGIDLGTNAVNSVMDVMDLNLEFEAASLARDPANYSDGNKVALTGTDKWSDPDSDPAADIKEARQAVRRKIGRYPNVLALSPNGFEALTAHPKIQENFKYTSSESITEVMLARYFKLAKVVVGETVILDENASDEDEAADVWGNDAILAFVPTPTTGNVQMPSYGYCYELSGYPQVEQPYYDRSKRSWLYPTTVERRPHLVGAEGGFLFKDVA